MFDNLKTTSDFRVEKFCPLSVNLLSLFLIDHHSPLSFFFFFKCSGPPRDLLSSPTRRSPDLDEARRFRISSQVADVFHVDKYTAVLLIVEGLPVGRRKLHIAFADYDCPVHYLPQHARSEEHTSELQSPCNLVCRLLLEKKKQS